MSINKNVILYFILFVLTSVIIIIEFYGKSDMPDWYFFIWLFNLNFLAYALYNNGSIVVEASFAHKNMLLQLNSIVSYFKVILIAATILKEITDSEIPYYYLFVIAILALDIFLLIFRSMNRRDDISEDKA